MTEKSSVGSKLKRSLESDQVNSGVFETIESVIACIKKSKKIIVISGAGISVSCGIPDFRSKDVGIYNNLNCESIDIPSAELLFDLEYFMMDPGPFYKFCKVLVPNDNIVPSVSHDFISKLEQKRKLLRNYTQNIDGLERKCGISDRKLIECHGSMSTFKCIRCGKKKSLEFVVGEIMDMRVCYCNCGGVMKPQITFFGEEVPNCFNRAIQDDMAKCDLVLIMGTSLKVGGSVVTLLKNTSHAPHFLINRDHIIPPKSTKDFDAVLLGDCDSVTAFLSQSLGWEHSDSVSIDRQIASSSTSVRMLLSSEKVGSNSYRIVKTTEDYAISISRSQILDRSVEIIESKDENIIMHESNERSKRHRKANSRYL